MYPSTHGHVNVVVLNYNGGTLVQNCLRSLFDTRFSSFDVTVVDNASTDGSPEEIAVRFPAVRIIRLSRNLGYSAANNIGIRSTAGQYAALLNSDTEVEPEWLANLVQVAERTPKAAFLQPKILLLGNHAILNSAGNEIHVAGFGICRGIGTADSGQYDKVESVGYASGACVLISRETLKDIGLLDEIFFAYGEDKDWGWRARMLGYRSIYVPTARVYHRWSAVLGSSPTKMYYLELERLISIWKNYSKGTIILLAPLLLLIELAVLFHAAKSHWLSYKIRAYAHALAQRAEVARRRKLLSKRKISDITIIRGFVSDLQHPYIGALAEPLSRICGLYLRLCHL
jgi:hypothetical protein